MFMINTAMDKEIVLKEAAGGNDAFDADRYFVRGPTGAAE